jgi:hypothetical protein
MPKSGQKRPTMSGKWDPEKWPSRVFKVSVILDWLYDALQSRGRYFTHRGLTSIRGNVLDFRLHIYRGFRAMISGISGAHAFRGDPPKSLCFRDF